MKNNVLDRKLANAAKWSTVTEFVVKIIQPITNMVLARLLAPEVFGVVATINMIISFTDMFTDSGFQKYLVQHEFKDDQEKVKCVAVAFWTNLAISLLLWSIIVAFSESIASLVGNPGLGYVISIACISLPLTSFSSIQMALFRRDFNYKPLFLVRIIGACIPFVVTIPLALIFHSYWALIIGTICGNVSNAILLTISSTLKPILFYSVSILKKIISFSIWSLVEAIAISLSCNIDIFILGNVISNYYLGIYKTSMITVNQIMGMITSATTPLLFAALSRLQDNDTKYTLMLFKFQRLVGLLVLPISVGIYMYSELITSIMLGGKWTEASNFIGLWGLMSGITIIFCHYSSEVYRSKGKPKLSVVAQSLHLVALIPAIIIGSRYDFQILYQIRTIASLQFFLIHMVLMYAVIKISPWEIFKNVFPSVISAATMGCLAFLLKRLSDGILWNFISIGICALFYFTMMLLFKKNRSELIELVRPKITTVILQIKNHNPNK